MKNLNSYKKIAKEFIKEAAWDRKFGEPLPTLEDVMKENTVKFKDKDGKDHEIDMDTAKQYKKDVDGGDDSDYKKTAVKAAGLDKDDKDSGEKDSGGKLGGSDFSRDFDDKGDEPKGEPSSKEPKKLSSDELQKVKDDAIQKAKQMEKDNPIMAQPIQTRQGVAYPGERQHYHQTGFDPYGQYAVQIAKTGNYDAPKDAPKDEPKDEPDSREKRLAKAKELSKQPVTDKDYNALDVAKAKLRNFERNKEVGRQSPKMRAKEEDLQSKVWDAESRIEDRRDAVINGEVEATPEEAEATVADLIYKVKNRETWWDKGDNETSATKWKKMKKDLKAYQKKVKHMKKGFFGDKYESISINGQKYKAIKESKEPTKPTIHPFKKMYKRIGGK